VRWWNGAMGIAIGYGTRKMLDVFLMFDQHREKHDLEGHITCQVGTGRRMFPGGREQFIERLLIFGAQSPSISTPIGDLFLNQLCKCGKGTPHMFLFLRHVRAVIQ